MSTKTERSTNLFYPPIYIIFCVIFMILKCRRFIRLLVIIPELIYINITIYMTLLIRYIAIRNGELYNTHIAPELFINQKSISRNLFSFTHSMIHRLITFFQIFFSNFYRLRSRLRTSHIISIPSSLQLKTKRMGRATRRKARMGSIRRLNGGR